MINQLRNKIRNNMEVIIMCLRKIKKTVLLSLSLLTGINSLSANNINNFLDNIDKLINKYEIAIQEFNSINPIKVKNGIIVGLLKHFNGEITFLDLAKLQNLEKTISPNNMLEISNFLIDQIPNKLRESDKNQAEIKLQNLKNKLDQIFKTNNLNITFENLGFYQNNNCIQKQIKELTSNPTIAKILTISKSNPQKLKIFLNYLVNSLCPANSQVKVTLLSIISEIETIL